MNREKLTDFTILALQGRLQEAVPKNTDGLKTITLTTRDNNNNLENLLEVIKSYSTMGHTFEVIVDPEDSEMKKSFYIDGDGSDQLFDIQVYINNKVEESKKSVWAIWDSSIDECVTDIDTESTSKDTSKALQFKSNKEAQKVVKELEHKENSKLGDICVVKLTKENNEWKID